LNCAKSATGDKVYIQHMICANCLTFLFILDDLFTNLRVFGIQRMLLSEKSNIIVIARNEAMTMMSKPRSALRSNDAFFLLFNLINTDQTDHCSFGYIPSNNPAYL